MKKSKLKKQLRKLIKTDEEILNQYLDLCMDWRMLLDEIHTLVNHPDQSEKIIEKYKTGTKEVFITNI